MCWPSIWRPVILGPLVRQGRGRLRGCHTLSPIDLIPDVIPILGYLDDMVIVPLGSWFAIHLIAPALLEEHRQAAMARHQPRPRSWVGAAIILGLWGLAGGAIVWWLMHEVSLRRDFAR